MRSAACILLACGLLQAGPRVEAMRTPNGGIQPQTVLKDGTLHLVYYAGESDKGDLFYVRSTDYGKSFSPALRVNSTPGSAIAVGNIRGAHLAVGRNGSGSSSKCRYSGSQMLCQRVVSSRHMVGNDEC